MLYYLFWYNKTQSRSFLIQLVTTMQWLWKFKQKIICEEQFRRNIESVFCYCRYLQITWLEHFLKFNKRGLWKIKLIIGGTCIRDLRVCLCNYWNNNLLQLGGGLSLNLYYFVFSFFCFVLFRFFFVFFWCRKRDS